MVVEVGVASSSQPAAEAGAQVAGRGGNAVDAAVAAVLCSTVTDPGLCSLAGSGALTIWPTGDDPVTIQGAPAMPGHAILREQFGQAILPVAMKYGGGWPTGVGYGSVAVHGLVAACGEAVTRYGNLPWRELLQPAIEVARDGFALGAGSHQFLEGTYEATFGWNLGAFADLIDADGNLCAEGSHIRIAHLDQSLERLALFGPGELYTGETGRRIASWVHENGGLLSGEDLAGYRPRVTPALRTDLGPWIVATYPPPSVGGATLLAMLRLLDEQLSDGWSDKSVARLVEVQREVLGYRLARLDDAGDLPVEVDRLLELARSGNLALGITSPSTVHTSSVDSTGLACAATASNGYGSGVVAPGTGIWLGNPLGEFELNRRDLTLREPGERLMTNMAPSVVRRDDTLLAIGSPGADRITTAILQTLLGFFGGLSLQEAVAHPRAHVELGGHGPRIAHETGIEVGGLGLPTRPFDGLNLFFGGVTAVCLTGGELVLAGDPRRGCGLAKGRSHR